MPIIAPATELVVPSSEVTLGITGVLPLVGGVFEMDSVGRKVSVAIDDLTNEV
jgi:hypothetical protein